MSGSTLTPERIRKRLSRVFVSAFPDLDLQEAPSATMETVQGWDSIATLTLFMLTEEDMSISLGYDRIGEIKSFADLEALLVSKI